MCLWVHTYISVSVRVCYVAMHIGVCVCEFTSMSVLSLGFVGFVKNNPHLEVVCRAGFSSLA